jgi:hypothetical protein
MSARRFFCVSFYDGDLDLLKYAGENYLVYFKGEENRARYEEFSEPNKVWIENTGYNLSAYLRFIEDHYDDLPEIVVFCKNSTYPRHVSEACFARLIMRDVYTPIVDPLVWEGMGFPVAIRSSVGDFLEINDSWYARTKRGRYFNDFSSFFHFVFPDAPTPTYLRFGPGANVVVPRSNIMLRSRAFYRNLRHFISYEELAVESFFVERALDAIFCAPFEENPALSVNLGPAEFAELAQSCKNSRRPPTSLRRAVTSIGYALSNVINKFSGSVP